MADPVIQPILLCVFEQLSGLKINFYKSEIFCFGDARDHEYQYSQLFGCNIGSYPFQVLIPFVIWGYTYILESCQIRIGRQ